MNVFLTGEKKVGKSTLIRKWAEEEANKGGFYTVKTETLFPGRISVHMLDASKDARPDAQNVIFFCKEGELGREIEGFTRLGRECLDNARGAKLIIMDELGYHEENTGEFTDMIMNALDGETPVLGVIQMADSEFLDGIINHPATKLIKVTPENRDELAVKTLGEIMGAR